MISIYCQYVFNFIGLSLHFIYILAIQCIVHVFQARNFVHMAVTNTFTLHSRDATMAVSSDSTTFYTFNFYDIRSI
jgi:hypothetical protein